MGLWEKGMPLLARPRLDHAAAVHRLPRATAPVHEHPGIPGIVQDAEHLAVLELAPDDLALMRAGRHAARKPQPLLPERADDGQGRGGLRERVEEQAHGLLDLLVGIHHQPPLGGRDESDRGPHDQLAATGFVEEAAPQAGPQDVELGLAHRAFQP